MRFQVVYKSKAHWSTMDVQIKNGQINFFLLDAANSIFYILDAITTINTVCPTAKIKYFGSTMQRDTANCAYFSLDDAYNLAKIPYLHEELEPFVTKGPIGNFSDYYHNMENMIMMHRLNPECAALFSKYGKNKIMEVAQHIEYISYLNLPKSFGAIIKNIQSLSMFEQNFANKGYHRPNLKSVDLYIQKHTNKVAIQNDALKHRKDKIKESTLAYLQERQEDYQTILATRQQLNKTISLSSLINLQHQINQMKQYAHTYLKNTPNYGTILHLADQLTERTQNLSCHLRVNQNPVDLISFKNSIVSLLHANDSVIKNHRQSWKVVIANILLALTGLGAIVLACQSITQQRLALFFNKTGREKQVEKIESSLNMIQDPTLIKAYTGVKMETLQNSKSIKLVVESISSFNDPTVFINP